MDDLARRSTRPRRPGARPARHRSCRQRRRRPPRGPPGTGRSGRRVDRVRQGCVMRAPWRAGARSAATPKDRALGRGAEPRRYTPDDDGACGAVGWRARAGLGAPRRRAGRRRASRRARDRDHRHWLRPRQAHRERRRAGDVDERDHHRARHPHRRRLPRQRSDRPRRGLRARVRGARHGRLLRGGQSPADRHDHRDGGARDRAAQRVRGADAAAGHAAARLSPVAPSEAPAATPSPSVVASPSAAPTPVVVATQSGGNGSALFLAVAVVGAIAVLAAIAGLIGASRRPGR